MDHSLEESKTSVVVCASHCGYRWSRQDRLSLQGASLSTASCLYLYLLHLDYLQTIEK